MKILSFFLIILLASCVQPLKIKRVKSNFKEIKSQKERVAIFIDLYLDPKLATNNEKQKTMIRTYKKNGKSYHDRNNYKTTYIIKDGIKDLFLNRVVYELNNLLPNLPIDYYFNLTLDDKNVLKERYNRSLELNFFIAKKYQVTYLFEFIPILNIISPTHWGEYYFNLEVIAKEGKDEYLADYNIVSYFSYIIFGPWRTKEQEKAFEKGTQKLFKEFKKSKAIDLVYGEYKFDKGVYENFNPREFGREYKKKSDKYQDEKILDSTDYAMEKESDYDDEYIFFLKEKGARVIQEGPYPESKYPIAFDIRGYNGFSKVTGTTTDSNYKQIIASGSTWKSNELEINFSTFNPISNFYVTPLFGYFSKDFTIKDFAIDVSEANEGKEGFIPGKTRDESGKEIDVSSLSYSSSFYSIYLGGEAGINIVVGGSSVQFIFNPKVYFNLLEARYSSFDTTLESYEGISFPLLSSFGASFQTGLFFPKVHFGFKMGWKVSYFRKFELGKPMTFNTNTQEGDFIKVKKVYIDEVNIFSSLAFIDLIIMF